jgi:hypothetical protein
MNAWMERLEEHERQEDVQQIHVDTG